jgi:hypothetical protein
MRQAIFSSGSEATPQVSSQVKNNMVANPGQFLYSTQIPVCLWFLQKMEKLVRQLSASTNNLSAFCAQF